MERKLSEILAGAGPLLRAEGDIDAAITAITADSRRAGPGTLFAAVPGTRADGHAFIPQAVAAGARAVLCRDIPADTRPGVAYVAVDDPARALGHAAQAFYGHPSRRMRVVGVTGTNGKTTVATLLYRVAMATGHKAGLFSTVRVMVGPDEEPATHTTPDPVSLAAAMGRMADAGCRYCFMEVSSHAADQRRVAGIEFAGGVFTNLTQDHLDYHGTMANYIAAKRKFFDSLPAGAFALTNGDDRNGAVMVQGTRARRHTYALRRPADFKARIVEKGIDGMLLEIGGQEVWTPLTGAFNAYNFAAALGAAALSGIDPQEALRALSAQPPVRGRFERMRAPSGAYVVVDYAHTPDAVTNVLETANDVRPAGGRLVTVIGAGGDRDATKRPLMGAEAARLSDTVIFTSDNPRSEDPQAIIEAMRGGLTPDQARRCLSIPDRREAIRAACAMAGPADVVVIAGKGHETYQEIGGQRHPFDDRQVAMECLGMAAPEAAEEQASIDVKH